MSESFSQNLSLNFDEKCINSAIFFSVQIQNCSVRSWTTSPKKSKIASTSWTTTSQSLAETCNDYSSLGYDLSMEDAEWHPITGLDLENIDIPGNEGIKTFAVVSIEKSLSNTGTKSVIIEVTFF